MSAEEIQETAPATEPEVLQAGITKKEPENVVESRLPEPPDFTKMIEKLLDEKKAMGVNFSDKDTYVRIFNEIAQQVGCSYNNVKKVAKKYLNASISIEKESVQSEKNVINIKKVGDDARPPPKRLPDAPPPKQVLTQEQSEKIRETQIEFETTMILMSFENIAGAEKMLLGFSPKSKKMKDRARVIAIYNQTMRDNGKPEEVINVGDKLMKYMLWFGIASIFLEPVAELLQGRQKNKKDTGGITQKVSSSMR